MKVEEMPIYIDSIELAKWFRELFKVMTKDDKFSIGQQMLRSSVSISSNIAEGVGRDSSPKMLLTYLGYSKGSLYEFKSQLTIIESDYSSCEVVSILKKRIISLEEGLGRFISYTEKKHFTK